MRKDSGMDGSLPLRGKCWCGVYLPRRPQAAPPRRPSSFSVLPSSAGPVTGTAISPLIIADAVVKEVGAPSNQSPQASLKSKISKVFLKKENVAELG